MSLAESTSGATELRIDESLCMGSGQCCWYAPETFDQDESTVAFVIDRHGDPDETIQTAIQACPTNAISLVAVDGRTAD